MRLTRVLSAFVIKRLKMQSGWEGEPFQARNFARGTRKGSAYSGKTRQRVYKRISGRRGSKARRNFVRTEPGCRFYKRSFAENPWQELQKKLESDRIDEGEIDLHLDEVDLNDHDGRTASNAEAPAQSSSGAHVDT